MDSHNFGFPDKMDFYKSEKSVEAKKDKVSFSKGKKEKIIVDELAKKEKLLDEYAQKAKTKTKKNKEQAKSRASRAGLVFPVARIHSKLKHMVPANSRVGGAAAVFMAAVIEYMVAELCELAGNAAKQAANRGEKVAEKRRTRINPRSIQFAINGDQEFAELLRTVTLSGGGVIPLTDQKLKERFSKDKFKPSEEIPELPLDEGSDEDMKEPEQEEPEEHEDDGDMEEGEDPAEDPAEDAAEEEQ